MSPYARAISLKLTMCAALLPIYAVSTSVQAQDCLTPAVGDLYTDKEAANASDNNNGIYPSEGGTGPFATIQKLVNTLQPGQCGWVKPAAVPYTETAKVSGQAIAGITFKRGGTSEAARIIVSGYPGTQPVIDQKRLKPDGSWGAAGFLIASGNYITIRNFEILNTSASNIHVQDSAGASYLVVENSHLHHSYAEENAGGVRLDGCNYCIVRNNRIHHHYRTFAGSTSNVFDSVPYGLNAGVHGFQPGSCSIENNLIYNVDKGVHLKQADAGPLDAHKVSGNIFVNMSEAAYKTGVQGAGMPAPRNLQFFNNVVYNAPAAVNSTQYDASNQAVSMKIYNNTIVNSAGLAGISNYTGVEIYNNIVYGETTFFASMTGLPKVFVASNPVSFKNLVTYYDNNLYHNRSLIFELGRNTSTEGSYQSLSAWRAAVHSELSYSNPDGRSLSSNPNFVNVAGGATALLKGSAADYALSSNSPALNAGRNGITIGAVRAGVAVGLLSGAVLPLSPPSAPILRVEAN